MGRQRHADDAERRAAAARRQRGYVAGGPLARTIWISKYYKGFACSAATSAGKWMARRRFQCSGSSTPASTSIHAQRWLVDDARAVVEGIATAGLVVDQPPELVVLPLEAGGYALAYRLRVRINADLIVYFVDARSGRIVLQYSDLQRQAAIGTGQGVFGDTKKVSARGISGDFVAEDLARPPDIATFDMKGNVSRTLNFLNGLVRLGVNDLASSSNNTWTDGPDVDGHVYAGYTYDYYLQAIRPPRSRQSGPASHRADPSGSTRQHLDRVLRHCRPVLPECVLCRRRRGGVRRRFAGWLRAPAIRADGRLLFRGPRYRRSRTEPRGHGIFVRPDLSQRVRRAERSLLRHHGGFR